MFSDFTPFWEFVSGPLHAGSWGPPCFGLQFFGRVDRRPQRIMTVTLKTSTIRIMGDRSDAGR